MKKEWQRAEKPKEEMKENEVSQDKEQEDKSHKAMESSLVDKESSNANTDAIQKLNQ